MFGHESDSKAKFTNTKTQQCIFKQSQMLGPEPYSYMQKPVLEAWLTLKDPQSGNDHLHIPEVYESLAYARILLYVFEPLHIRYSARMFDTLPL